MLGVVLLLDLIFLLVGIWIKVVFNMIYFCLNIKINVRNG